MQRDCTYSELVYYEEKEEAKISILCWMDSSYFIRNVTLYCILIPQNNYCSNNDFLLN